MKKQFRIGLMLLIAILGYVSFSQKSEKKPEEAATENHSVPVTTESAESRKQAHETLSFTGTVSAEGVADMVSRTTGIVINSYPTIGSRVIEGTILATIDDRSSNSQPYLGFRSPDVREAGLSVERAKKTHQEAKRDDDRDDTRDSELAKDLAKANLASAESALQAVLDTHIVRSPLSGIVTAKHVAQGDSVSVGSPLLTIEKSGAKRIVRFFVSEEDRSLLQVGMTARISTKHADTEATDGKILHVSSVADSGSRRFLVEAETNEPLASGSIVSVAIDIVRVAKPGNIFLPLSAITFGQDRETIFVENDGRAGSTPVSVIRIDGELAEISAPIGDDAQIIIENAKRVKDGTSVSATNR
jgi:RND family efflux transporter MFP subunit